MDERALSELRGLAARDAELGERRAALAERDAEITAIRARAEEIEAALSALPAERERRQAELDDAQAELEQRYEELAHAERVLEEAEDDEERERGRRAVDRARDHIAVARAHVDRAGAALAELERDETELPRELEELEVRARAVQGAELGGSLVEWASRAHAEAFVAAGQIDTERERVIREANELASMLLGEPTYGSTPAQALARVEGLTTTRSRKD